MGTLNFITVEKYEIKKNNDRDRPGQSQYGKRSPTKRELLLKNLT